MMADQQNNNELLLSIEKLDLNLATQNDFTAIIGEPSPANVIESAELVEYRETYGKFRSFKQVEINGVGPATLNKLKEKFYIQVLPLHAERLIPEDYVCRDVPMRDIEKINTLPTEKDEQKKMLLFLHVNIRGLITNKHKLIDFLEACNNRPDVICVSETKLTENQLNLTAEQLELTEEQKELVNIPHYNFANFTINTNGAGGVAIYVKGNTTITSIPQNDLKFSMDNCCNVWIEITTDEKNVVIGAIYRPSRSDEENVTLFATLLTETMSIIEDQDKTFYILGDFNLDMQSTKQPIQDYCDELYEKCSLLITKPTRLSIQTKKGILYRKKSLIDHIYTNDENEDSSSGVVQTYDVSDHYPIYCYA